MRCGRVLVGLVALTLLVSACTSGEGGETTTTRAVVATTTTTEPPLDMQAHAESLLVGIRSEGNFMDLDAPGAVTIGEGSGVAVAADGLILTAATSVIGADRINVYVPGEDFPLVGQLDAAAECVNLALVRVDYTFSATLATDAGGPPVAAASAEQGTVSALPVSASQRVDGYSLSTPRNIPTGGVIFDEEGGFAGIVTGFDSSGDPFALFGDTAGDWVRRMRQRDVVQQLGFAPVVNSEGQAVVAAVAESGPAVDLGLAVGDVITRADGADLVDGVSQLCSSLADGTADLEVIKDGRRHVGTMPTGELVLASARTTEQIRQAVFEVNNATGFFISEDGYAVTNYHVAGWDDEVELRFDASTDEIPARVVAASACADIAVIKAEGSYKYLEWAPQPPQLEEPVRVVGFPNFTDTISFQDGIVAKEVADGARWGGFLTNFESSAKTDGGNSGGPVVNADGEILGVHYASARGNQEVIRNPRHLVGVEVRDVVAGLRSGTLADPGFTLGDWDYADGVDLQGITEVFPGGPAAQMGLRSGDALAQLGELEDAYSLFDFEEVCSYVTEAGPEAVHDVIGYRPSADAFFEGQINGRPLSEWPDDIRRESLDGTIAASIPGNWAEYEAIEPADGNDWVGFFAAPNVDDYFGRFGVSPGMRLMWSYQRGEEYDTRSWFDAVSYGNLAVGSPDEFYDFRYEGHVQYFETPSGSLSLEYALRSVEDPNGPLILLFISLPDALLPGKAYEILDSLDVDPPPPPPPPEE